MVGVWFSVYVLGLIAQNCSHLLTKTAQNSMKNLSGDIRVVLKTELAIILVGAVISNGIKGKKRKNNQNKLENQPKAVS